MTIRSLLLSVILIVPAVAGAQTDAFCTAVYDANGMRVARTPAATESWASVFFANQGRVASFLVTRNELRSGGAPLYFTGYNCTGDELMVWESRVQPHSHSVGTDVWHPDTFAVPALLNPNSKRESGSGGCEPSLSSPGLGVPALNFTLPTFTPPFHLEPEDCGSIASVATLGPRSLFSLCVVIAFGAVLLMRRPQRAAGT